MSPPAYNASVVSLWARRPAAALSATPAGLGRCSPRHQPTPAAGPWGSPARQPGSAAVSACSIRKQPRPALSTCPQLCRSLRSRAQQGLSGHHQGPAGRATPAAASCPSRAPQGHGPPSSATAWPQRAAGRKQGGMGGMLAARASPPPSDRATQNGVGIRSRDAKRVTSSWLVSG